MNFIEILNQLEKLKYKIINKKVIIFGAGETGILVYSICNLLGINISYFVDNSNLKWEKKQYGLDVNNPSILEREDSTQIALIIATIQYTSIADQLTRMGFTEGIHYFSISSNVLTHYSPKWITVKNGLMKGGKIYIEPENVWQGDMEEGIFDNFIYDFLSDISLKHKIIFDIGAHIGYHSLCFAKLVGDEGKVISFEPNKSNIERFKINFSANSEFINRIVLEEVAVSSESGYSEFYFSDNVDNGTSSGSFLLGSSTALNINQYINMGFKKDGIITISLDNYCSRNNYVPSLIKIDVEGAEHLVLYGAENILKKYKPILLIEIHSIFSMYEVMSKLIELKYITSIIHQESDGRCFITAI